MPAKKITRTQEQWEFLESQMPTYLEYTAQGKSKAFQSMIESEWAERFPEIDELKITEPSIFAANARVPSNNPTLADEEDTSGLPPFVWTQRVDEIYGEAVRMRKKVSYLLQVPTRENSIYILTF